MTLFMDAHLALVMIAMLPFIFVTIMFIKNSGVPLYAKVQRSVDGMVRVVREDIQGIRVIKALSKTDYEHRRYDAVNRALSGDEIHAGVITGSVNPIMTMFMNLGSVAVIALGAVRVSKGLSNPETVIAFIQCFTLISNAMLSVTRIFVMYTKCAASAKRISEVFDMPVADEGADDHTEPRFPLSEGVRIDMKGVSLAYLDAQCESLADIDFYADKGETVAIIGGTGSGKTTLIRALLALYPIKSGDIFVNGVSYKELTKGEIRLAYSVSLQKAMIFEGTLRDNVSMGRSDATDREITEVLTDVAMDEFLRSKEEGLDFVLVGLGQNVSGGQKQRINMARTVIRNSPVYIFDDSFSALDYLTERKIQAALFKRLLGKTKILVTQRVSTALAADRIYVMDNGRISACGTHKELIRTSDIYREICISQLGIQSIGGDGYEK
jgi:ATP-binding cassette subfamily B protein